MSLEEVDGYLAALEKAKKMRVAVGVTSDVGHTYPHGETVQEVANNHEFGIGVPRRSFLRVPFELKGESIARYIQKRFVAVLDGADVKKELGLVGVFAENISSDSFETGGYGKWADISEETKATKGSDSILIDTGALSQSITSDVR